MGEFVMFDKVIYEPKTNGNKNPEMRFVLDETFIDIEVKTPNFADVDFVYSNYTITTTLLDGDGRAQIKKLENKYGIKTTLPRIKKIVDYLNSAAAKFVETSDKQINILFINWTYTDAAVGGIVEPASLLSNKNNGILFCPEIGKIVVKRRARGGDFRRLFSAFLPIRLCRVIPDGMMLSA